MTAAGGVGVRLPERGSAAAGSRAAPVACAGSVRPRCPAPGGDAGDGDRGRRALALARARSGLVVRSPARPRSGAEPRSQYRSYTARRVRVRTFHDRDPIKSCTRVRRRRVCRFCTVARSSVIHGRRRPVRPAAGPRAPGRGRNSSPRGRERRADPQAHGRRSAAVQESEVARVRDGDFLHSHLG